MQAGRLNRRCILQAPRTTSKTGCDNSEPPPHIAESLLASINVTAGF